MGRYDTIRYNTMYSEPTFISKYTPSHLRDFEYDDAQLHQRVVSKTTYILNTLIEIQDLNILLIGGINSGKTTILYALLREYYGLPRHASIPETNVLFINNLKEQGIQYFRNEMKTFCQSSCSVFGKKKIIMVDDIDSVPKQSQQVFRNCIDKYKNNVHVIASCSNTQKVVESLQSRLHIIHVAPPSPAQMESVMDRIIREEVILVDKDTRQYLVDRSNNSIRNIMNNLEKLSLFSNDGVILSKQVCQQLCSNISYNQFDEYIISAKNGRLADAVKTMYVIYDYGYSVIDILEYLFGFIKQTPLLREDQKYRLIPHLCNYITIFHNTHENCIELALLTNRVVEELAE